MKTVIKALWLLPFGIVCGYGVGFCKDIDPIYPYLIGVVQVGVSIWIIRLVDRKTD